MFNYYIICIFYFLINKSVNICSNYYITFFIYNKSKLLIKYLIKYVYISKKLQKFKK